MTGFKVGDRVRRAKEPFYAFALHSEWTVARVFDDGYFYAKEDNRGHRLNPHNFELVSPAPTEVPVADWEQRILLNTELDELNQLRQRELDEFKAKVVEVLRNRMGGRYDDWIQDILGDLGLTAPSRFRVTFEVEADSEDDAVNELESMDMSAAYQSGYARVAKIEEE